MTRRRPVLCLLALGLASASLPPGTAGAAGATGPDPGVELEETAAIPSLLLDNAVTAADLTGDGADELIVLSDNGVAQRYDVDTGFRWSVSTIEIADRLGIRPFEYTSRFEADYRGLFQCTTDHGVAFIERTGDDVLDVVATTWLRLGEGSDVEQRSYVVELDGENGAILALHRFEGHVTNLLPAGGSDLFVVEEDGPVDQAEVGSSVVERGTGGTTRIHRYDLEQARSVWTHDTDRSWGRASAVTVGSLDGQGDDVALALASSATKPVGGSVSCAGEPDVEPAANDLIALDGATGNPLWSSPAPKTVRELLTTRNEAEGGEAVVVLARGAVGSSVRSVDGATGETRWTAALPSGAVAWDLEPHGGRIAAAYATPGPAAAAGDLSRLALIDA
ncbi:MAG: hypothetical protein ACRDH9_01195, partial [Actinomycetota bacterium]